MIEVVKNGKPGTAMVGWKTQLSDAQIGSLVDYVRTRFMTMPEERPPPPGAEIYASTCSVCHGEDGAGALWGRTSLSPPPVDFTAKDPTRDLPRGRMVASVTFGRPGTAMTAFRSQLSEEQIGAVVDYIRDTFMAAKDRDPFHSSAPPIPEAATSVGMAVLHGRSLSSDEGPTLATGVRMDLPMPRGLEGDERTGQAFYQANCAACHGRGGEGDGPRAYFIFPRPRNFVHPASRNRLNRPALFQAISRGVPRREMPAWDMVLSDQQIADVAEYVFRTFVRPSGSGERR
jgi:mono/diheme cytochrome c family protein